MIGEEGTRVVVVVSGRRRLALGEGKNADQHSSYNGKNARRRDGENRVLLCQLSFGKGIQS